MLRDLESGQWTRAPNKEEVGEELRKAVSRMDPNTVVNVVNLAVSVYNAYQLREVRKGVARLEASTQRIEEGLAAFRVSADAQHEVLKNILKQQSAMLGALLDGQQTALQQLDVIRREMAEGFNATHEAIADADAHRIANELGSRTKTLLRHQAALGDAAAGGGDFKSAAAPVINTAADLLGWLDEQLERHVVGAPARLPLLLSKAAVLRMRLDARCFAGEPASGVDRERAEFADEIAREAFAVSDGRTIYTLSTTHADLLATYVFLHRAFFIQTKMAFNEQGELVPLFPAGTDSWDDHLASVRASLTRRAGDVSTSTSVSIDDERWLNAFKEKERDPREILDVLGVPRSVSDVAIDELLALRPFIDAKGRGEVADHLQREFGWQRPPQIVTVDALAPAEVTR